MSLFLSFSPLSQEREEQRFRWDKGSVASSPLPALAAEKREEEADAGASCQLGGRASFRFPDRSLIGVSTKRAMPASVASP
jgi:hypothetical protein